MATQKSSQYFNEGKKDYLSIGKYSNAKILAEENSIEA